ncbi:hypothetical protein IAT38_003941 [Cryptococcus sp. DSM 104549]
MVMGEFERLSDVTKLSAHVTRVLGQNPGMMTLQGTNSYLLQPPSNPHAPLILIDTSSPHTAQQYVDLLFTHLHHLGLESGVRETHFESSAAKLSLRNFNEERHDEIKEEILRARKEDPRADELGLVEYGPGSTWVNPVDGAVQGNGKNSGERRLPVVEHIILTHRHLDHVGALPLLLKTLQEHGCPPPKLWKLPSPDEAILAASERERPTSDAAIWQTLPPGTYHSFSPFQPFHPVMPGLMISIIDPAYRHLLKHDKDGKAKWNEVPEIARVSVRCLKTPGHTQDSISLVLSEGERGVFTGDTVLGHGTTHFADLSSYMTSLRTLLALKPRVLYPAHGAHVPTPEASRAHIEQYIAHRHEREAQICSILQLFSPSASISEKIPPLALGEILLELKKGIHEKQEAENKARGPLMADKRKPRTLPELEEEKAALDKVDVSHGISMSVICRLLYKSEDEKLLFAAARPTAAHLEKLVKDGKVQKTRVNMCKLVGSEVGEVEEMDGWKWVAGKEEKKEKLD